MQLTFLTPILLLLSASSPVLAKGNSTASQCRTMSRLEKIVTVANNATLLAEITNNNATKAAEIQSKASEAATTLATMQSNTTLVTVCAQRAAVEQTAETCIMQSKLERAIAKAANSTSAKMRRAMGPGEGLPDLQARKNRNGTHTIDVAAAQETLATLASNATLQQFCAMMATESDCKAISRLNRMMTIASNTTLLAERFDNNATKIAEFQAKATEAQTKLTSLTSNTTLTSICSTEAQTSNSGTTTGSEAATTSTESTAPRTNFNGALMSTVFGIFGISLVVALL